jgi:hypothetical protein
MTIEKTAQEKGGGVEEGRHLLVLVSEMMYHMDKRMFEWLLSTSSVLVLLAGTRKAPCG